MSLSKVAFLSDLHPRSDRALDRAALVADATGASLDVVHAIDPDSDSARAHARTEAPLLTDTAGNLRSALALSAPVRTNWAGLEGSATSVLARHVQDSGPDLVVAGMGRDYTMAKLVIGSTVDRIVAATGSPVLVVKRRPNGPYKKVTIAFDGTDRARAALESALRIAPRAQLFIVYALEGAHENDHGNAEDRIRSHVERILTELAGTDVEVPAQFDLILRGGDIIDAMKAVEKEFSPDLAAFGRTARTGLKALIQGSDGHLLLAHLRSDCLVGRKSS